MTSQSSLLPVSIRRLEPNSVLHVAIILLSLLTMLSEGVTLAEDVAAPTTATVDLVVGDWLPGEREGKARSNDESATKTVLDFPFGVDFDRAGAMFICEMSGNRIFRLEADGELTLIAGTGTAGYSGDGGPATAATFREMHNIAMGSDDSIFVADSANHAIRRIDSKSRQVSTFAGNGKPGFDDDRGTAPAARFRKTICITFDPAKKTLLVADIYNIRIRAIDIAEGTVRTIAGNGKSGVPQDGAVAARSPLVDPRAVAADAEGNVYVLERAGHALRVVDQDGTIRTVAGSGRKGYRDGPALEAQFDGPKHLCIDDAGNVYIADDVNGAIRKYDPKSATVSTVLGRGQGDSRVKLDKPHGVCFHQGTLYVVDSGNNRVLSLRTEADNE